MRSREEGKRGGEGLRAYFWLRDVSIDVKQGEKERRTGQVEERGKREDGKEVKGGEKD